MRTHQADGVSGLAAVSAQESTGGPLEAREVTQVGVQVARVWAAALPTLRVAAVQAWLSTLDVDERLRESRQAMALAEWLIAYSKEALKPRHTAEELAQVRRISGVSMSEIFDALFNDFMAPLEEILAARQSAAAEGEKERTV